MTLSSPLWLISLIPWAALVLWLLLRRRETTGVTFLPLWIGTTAKPGRRISFGLPPIALMLILLAILLSLLGAADPQVDRMIKTATVQLPPQATITLLSASDEPRAQVMVQITTARFDRPDVELFLSSANERIVQKVTVAPDDVKNVFVDFKSLGQRVAASLAKKPAVTIERTGRPIAIAEDARVPPTLRRLIEIIQQHRVADQTNAITIGISPSLDSSRTGIVLAVPAASNPIHWTVMDDPLTRDMDWSELTGGCAVDPSWEPLVFNGDRVLIARHKHSPTQILTSVSTLDWPSMPSFVVFWTNTIHELAGGDGQFRSYQPEPAFMDEKPISPQLALFDLSPALFVSALLAILLAGLVVPRRSISYTAKHAEQAANSHG